MCVTDRCAEVAPCLLDIPDQLSPGPRYRLASRTGTGDGGAGRNDEGGEGRRDEGGEGRRAEGGEGLLDRCHL